MFLIAFQNEFAKSTNIFSGLFGPHPSDCSIVFERELNSKSNHLEWWHPGRLLHYGRAELKTSDHRYVNTWYCISLTHTLTHSFTHSLPHLLTSPTRSHRPVIAILDVDVVEVDKKRRNTVKDLVLEELGSSDPTVVVTVTNSQFNCVDVHALVECLHKYGDIVLVR